MNRKWLSHRIALFLLTILLPNSPNSAVAERPAAPEILPEKTLALVRVADAHEFVERFRETSTGRMLKDEQMQPLAQRLYGNAIEAFGKVQDKFGLPLDQLLAIPQGELFFAVVTVPDSPPAMVLLIEVKDQLAAATKLMDRLQEEMQKDGATKKTEVFGDTKLAILTPSNDPNSVTFFEREGAVVLTTNVEAAKHLLALWRGEQKADTTTLANNRKFTTIMNRCQGSRDERPHLAFYVDPIEIVRATTRGNVAAQTGLALLPAFGLDGLQGLGGSLILMPGEFDSVMHFHALLDNPRSGVIKAIAMESGDSSPEPWIPKDITTYGTVHWNFATTLHEVARLQDTFQGEGAHAAWIQRRISEPLGVDFEKEILAAVDSRLTYIAWLDKPIRINSQSHLLALKLKDATKFRTTLDKILEKNANRFEKRTFGGTSYHVAVLNNPNQNRTPRPNDAARLELRNPEPCIGILGDYIVGADSINLLHQCITAKNDAQKSLASELDFKLIASKIARQVGGAKPGGIAFHRPEEGLRLLYEFAIADGTRKTLAHRAEKNELLKTLNTALTDHPLPPFSAIAKYYAPTGGMLTNDETGIHYTAFALKRK